MSTFFWKAPVLLSLAVLTLPGTGAAQYTSSMPAGPRLVIYADGGGLSPLTELNDAGTTKFKTGFILGAGLGVVGRHFGIRGDFNWSQARIKEDATTFADQKFDKFYYGGELLLQHLSASGFTPYLGVGAGAVTIKAKNEAVLPSFTKVAGRSSLGLKYVTPSGFGIFGQATGWLYKWDRGGFDKTQVDLQYVGGVSYSFGR